jgi:hypothetical protein
MDSRGATTSGFAQMVAVTTYARNEQVKGSIPLGGSTPDQRECVRQVCADHYQLPLLSHPSLWWAAFRTTFDLACECCASWFSARTRSGELDPRSRQRPWPELGQGARLRFGALGRCRDRRGGGCLVLLAHSLGPRWDPEW